MTEPNEPNKRNEPNERNEPVEPNGAVRPGEAAATGEAAVAAPPVGWLPRSALELFGEGATAEEAYGLLTVDVPADSWIASLETARDTLGCTYFDWLSAVDEPGTGFRVAAYVVALGTPGTPASGPGVRGLLVRTTVPHDAATLPTATGVYAGAAWHERETHEMFGIGFTGHPGLAPLLLPDGFEGHPLRKDFVLAARVVKAWPGAKEPGESGAGHGPKRRQMLPPGVPDPNEWGPLKGQLPPAPARPARGARAAGAAGAAAGERPTRRTRSATAGSASQRATGEKSTEEPSAPAAERPARRARSVSEGSASQRAAGPEASAPAPAERPARRARSASEGSASQRAAADEPTTPEAPARPSAAPAADGAAGSAPPSSSRPRRPATRTRSSDAPWHHARPARDEDADSEREPEARDDSESPDHSDRSDRSDDQPGGTA
ncbi:NADH-quinone oxidoreductase subunit C [Streptomyces sp. NPDC044780]|uniref:NADH-quinone oxidoreductase subunit C n=2 Tax=Streptomyces TaxID=1883 RepID=UPI0033EC357D